MQIGTKPCQIKCSTFSLSEVALTTGVIKKKTVILLWERVLRGFVPWVARVNSANVCQIRVLTLTGFTKNEPAGRINFNAQQKLLLQNTMAWRNGEEWRVEKKGKTSLFLSEGLMIMSCLMIALAESDGLGSDPTSFWILPSENILEIVGFVLGLEFLLPASF